MTTKDQLIIVPSQQQPSTAIAAAERLKGRHNTAIFPAPATAFNQTMLTTNLVKVRLKLLKDRLCPSVNKGHSKGPPFTAFLFKLLRQLRQLRAWLGSWLLFFLVVWCGVGGVDGLRCYTDVKATKSQSVECGLNTGCVKIFIDSEEMLYKKQQEYGYVYGYQPGAGDPGQITLPERYQGNPVLMRGCFVLAVPDRCYMAKNGLSYCWCSTKDLCNHSPPTAAATIWTLMPPLIVYLWQKWWWWQPIIS